MSTPKKGDILYHVQSDKSGLSWVGIAYQVTVASGEVGSYTGEAVATAVSGSEKKVRSMLKAKLKKKGIKA